MHSLSSAFLLFYSWGKKPHREKSRKRLRSRLHTREAGTAAGDTGGCSVTAPPPTWLTGVVFHVHLLLPCSSTPSHLTELLLRPRRTPLPDFLLSVKKGADKPCICICIERHFQRHSQGNGLAEYRCYRRMTTIQVILQLHYLSGEIRLVYIFTRIISFKSADHILCTLRNEAALVHRKELQFFPQRPPSTGTPEPEVTKTQRSRLKCWRPYPSFGHRKWEGVMQKALMETRVCTWALSLSCSYPAHGRTRDSALSAPKRCCWAQSHTQRWRRARRTELGKLSSFLFHKEAFLFVLTGTTLNPRWSIPLCLHPGLKGQL